MPVSSFFFGGLLEEVSCAVWLFGLVGIPSTPPIEGRSEVFKELESRGGGGLPSSEDMYLRFVLLLRGDVTGGSGTAVLAIGVFRPVGSTLEGMGP